MPVGSYPLLSKKHNQNGKIVIVNLQPTRLDNRADLIINAKIDVIFQILFDKHFKLKIEIDEYYLSQENNQVDTKNKLTLNYSYVYTYIKKEEEKAINLEDNKQKMIKNEPNQPDLVLILNGKRKSGKDYVYKKLIEHLQNQKPDVFNFTIITLSAPLKQMYAQENGLNYERLLDSSDYKETYRLDMIKWSDSKREQNPFIFCQKAIEQPLEQVCLNDKSNQLNVWIVSDARRKTDLNFFSENFPSQIKTVQIHAEDSIRQERNWIFTEGILCLFICYKYKKNHSENENRCGRFNFRM
jgi:phosphomevalonate kinase